MRTYCGGPFRDLESRLDFIRENIFDEEHKKKRAGKLSKSKKIAQE
jgi:hypothetical protein